MCCFYDKLFRWLVLLGSCVPTLFMLLVFVFLSWQEKCVCLNPEDDEEDPHIRPPPRCATHASAVITNTRWLRLIIFVTSASFICATSLISIVCAVIWQCLTMTSIMQKIKSRSKFDCYFRSISSHQTRSCWKLTLQLKTITILSCRTSTDLSMMTWTIIILLPDLKAWESVRIMITQMLFMYQ